MTLAESRKYFQLGVEEKVPLGQQQQIGPF